MPATHGIENLAAAAFTHGGTAIIGQLDEPLPTIGLHLNLTLAAYVPEDVLDQHLAFVGSGGGEDHSSTGK